MLWDISSRQIRWLTWTWRKSTGPVCRGLTEERGLHLLCLWVGDKFRGSHSRHNPGTVQMARTHASCALTRSPFPTNLTSICLEAVFYQFQWPIVSPWRRHTVAFFFFACKIFATVYGQYSHQLISWDLIDLVKLFGWASFKNLYFCRYAKGSKQKCKK